MAASASPYDRLGIEPGAERSVIDAAYRGLMKLHHPDRGGDPAVAADINRAYAALTRPGQEVAAERSHDLTSALYARRRAARAARRSRPRRGAWPIWLALVAIVGTAASIGRERLTDAAWTLQWRYFQPSAASSGTPSTNLAGDASAPLDSTPIAARDLSTAIDEAHSALRKGGLGQAADRSAACYRGFAATPTLAAYDRCVMFDDAVLLLAGANAVDRGVFSAASLTARQLAAGRTLEANYDVIEDRLDRIRQRTRRAIQPPPPTSALPPPPPQPAP